MCGIAGALALVGELDADSAATVGEMIGALRHRGPDGSGIWTSDRAILGHRRLSIIDTSECGHQPMVSRTGRYAVTFNGEIYNHAELGAAFRGDGWSPLGSSDTEVLLEAVERWGVAATLGAVDGMFALVLVDRELGRAHLVRDRFGEKPLVHVTLGRRLWFGSDVSALVRVPGFSRNVSTDAVRDLLRHGFISRDLSIFDGVEKLEPGQNLTIELGTGVRSESRFWSIPSRNEAGGDRSPERLGELLDRSVGRRLQSDRPLGAFLSGGIDSALTCAIAARKVARLDTFTMTWGDREYDESGQAAAIASRLGANHHEIILDETDLVEAVRHVATIFDEPFADSSAVAVHAVARFARESVVVCLSGDGGDEMFAGYNRHRWLLRLDRQRKLPNPVRRSVAGIIARGAGAAERLSTPISTSVRPRLVRDKLTKLARAIASPDNLAAYLNVLAQSDVDAPERALPENVTTALLGRSPDELLWAVRAADIFGYLPDDILTKVDRATMSVGLECRTPFLEPEICELAMGLGARELIGRDGGKQPLRRMLDSLLPGVSFGQPKSGFGVPVGRLMRGALRSQVVEAAGAFDSRGIVPEISFRDETEQLLSGDDSMTTAIWAVVMFEMWADTHLGSTRR